MRKKIDPVVDEAIETLNMKDGPSRRQLLEGAGLFSATAAASALIAACSSSSSSSAAPTGTRGGRRGQLPDHAQVEVHVREPRHGQPVLHADPVRHADAAALLGLPTPAWSGSTTSSTQPTNSTMLSASRPRSRRRLSGIATTVVSATSFTTPINSALQAGIPVVTYNANGATRQPHQRPGLHRPGAAHLGSGGGQAARLADEEGRHGGRRHRPARLAEHPAAHGRRHAGPGGGRA